MRRRAVRSYTNSLLDANPADFIDEELVDIASLWILRILFKLRGYRNFIDNNGYISKDSILYFLDGSKYLDDNKDDLEVKKDILNDFSNKLDILETRQPFDISNTTIFKNVEKLSKLINLNVYEKKILIFFILVKQHEILSDATSLIGDNLTTKQAKKAFSVILDIPYKDVEKAFKSSSKLSSSSLLSVEKRNTNSFDYKFDSISDNFIDNMANSDEDILSMLKDILRQSDRGNLCLDDYHVKKDMDILLPYLQKSLKKGRRGVNILLYGQAGTGKSELSKLLSKELKANLYEVSYANEDDEPIDGKERVKAYKSAQILLRNGKTLLVYDEAEDIFESSGGNFFQPSSRQRDKAWINKMLETNAIPTIWITNNINSIDEAIIRRFDYTLEMSVPKKSQRKKIIKKYSKKMLDKKTINLLASKPYITPAVISRAIGVAKHLDIEDKQSELMRIINNTIKAQGYKVAKKEKKLKEKEKLPKNYNTNIINCDTNLEELVRGIKNRANARICLYGPAGTGKSAYAKYIAKKLNKPFILKKGSDLLGMYVGQTEQNIANAFKEAKKRKGVLVFDEVDSFLSDRGSAQRSWEISQVNEMLVQMENFDGIFIATTNLMEHLDKASLRRFDLKLKFDFLKPEQVWEMFLSNLKELKLNDNPFQFKREVKSIRNLTPGDFTEVIRQDRFKPVKDIKDFLQRLKDEVRVKELDSGYKMGFM